MTDTITFDDFKKLHIRIGTITTAERVPDADKLIKLTVDFGDENPFDKTQGKRQIMAGISEWFPDPGVLVGKQVPILVNLETKKLRGYESQGMMLAADENGPMLLHPAKKVTPGTIVR